VVLVIRCGIGLLPLLCARDGKAKKVIALEQSACIEYARRIITDNRYSTVITLVQSNVRKMSLLLFLYYLLLDYTSYHMLHKSWRLIIVPSSAIFLVRLSNCYNLTEKMPLEGITISFQFS